MAWGGGSHGSTPFGSTSVDADLSVSIAGTSTLTASIVDAGQPIVPDVLHVLKDSAVSHTLSVAGVSRVLVDSKVTHFT